LEKRSLYIVGGGDFGREMETHLDRVPESDRDWRIAGFLDNDPSSVEGYPSDYRVLGSASDYQFSTSDLAVIAVATPNVKRGLFDSLRRKVKLLTFISPDAIIGKFTRRGLHYRSTGCDWSKRDLGRCRVC